MLVVGFWLLCSLLRANSMAGILRPFHTDKMWGHEDTAPSSRKFDKTGSKDGEIGVGKYSELETRMS